MSVIYGSLNLFDSVQHFLLSTDAGDTPLEISTPELVAQLVEACYSYDVNNIQLDGPVAYLYQFKEAIERTNENLYSNNKKIEVTIND